jgi:hypothetical protein
VKRTFGRILAGAAVTATAGTALITSTAFADSDCDSGCGGSSHHHTSVRGDYYKNYRGARAHEGGNGGHGGTTNSKCLVPVGLSAGAVASSGGQVDQCNSSGGNGGEGGAGDVGINH